MRARIARLLRLTADRVDPVASTGDQVVTWVTEYIGQPTREQAAMMRALYDGPGLKIGRRR